MNSWRVSKYNPKFRDENGAYVNNEWTSISDIGKIYNGIEFTLQDYYKTEETYINTIQLVIDMLQIPSLKVVDLEKNSMGKKGIKNYKSLYNKEIYKVFRNIKNNETCQGEIIFNICRLVLREHLWLKFEYKKDFFIHFGYDYYLYIVSHAIEDTIISKINKLGLFIEQYLSPY